MWTADLIAETFRARFTFMYRPHTEDFEYTLEMMITSLEPSLHLPKIHDFMLPLEIARFQDYLRDYLNQRPELVFGEPILPEFSYPYVPYTSIFQFQALRGEIRECDENEQGAVCGSAAIRFMVKLDAESSGYVGAESRIDLSVLVSYLRQLEQVNKPSE